MHSTMPTISCSGKFSTSARGARTSGGSTASQSTIRRRSAPSSPRPLTSIARRSRPRTIPTLRCMPSALRVRFRHPLRARSISGGSCRKCALRPHSPDPSRRYSGASTRTARARETTSGTHQDSARPQAPRVILYCPSSTREKPRRRPFTGMHRTTYCPISRQRRGCVGFATSQHSTSLRTGRSMASPPAPISRRRLPRAASPPGICWNTR